MSGVRVGKKSIVRALHQMKGERYRGVPIVLQAERGKGEKKTSALRLGGGKKKKKRGWFMSSIFDRGEREGPQTERRPRIYPIQKKRVLGGRVDVWGGKGKRAKIDLIKTKSLREGKKLWELSWASTSAWGERRRKRAT